jgi:GNAT superfamily N-acetyltransferase
MNYLHETYKAEFYSIIDETVTPAGNGLLRRFAYRTNTRFALLFKHQPAPYECAYTIKWLGNDSGSLWYYQMNGFDMDLVNELDVKDEPFLFNEMRSDNIVKNAGLLDLSKRAYKPADLDLCIDLLESAYTPFLDPTGYYICEKEWYANLFANGNTVLFFIQDRLAAMYCRTNEMIECICVHPDFQGKGYGRAVLMDMQMSKLRLTVAMMNTRAIQLYKSCGFQTICQSARVTI